MMRAIDLIVQHNRGWWKHERTGQYHRVVFACPHEVVTFSETESWLGKASDFIREFDLVEFAP